MFAKITVEGGEWDRCGDEDGGDLLLFDSGELPGVFFSFWGW